MDAMIIIGLKKLHFKFIEQNLAKHLFFIIDALSPMNRKQGNHMFEIFLTKHDQKD